MADVKGSRCPRCHSRKRKPAEQLNRAYDAPPEHSWVGMVVCLGCGHEYEPYELGEDELPTRPVQPVEEE